MRKTFKNQQKTTLKEDLIFVVVAVIVIGALFSIFVFIAKLIV